MTDPKNLETWLHETVGPAYDALKADPARAVTPDQVRHTLDKLLAEDLQTTEAMAAFLAAAAASTDPTYIERAREVAARAKAMHGLEG